MTRETAQLCIAVEGMKSQLAGLRKLLGITPRCPCFACHEDAQKPAAEPAKPTPPKGDMLH